MKATVHTAGPTKAKVHSPFKAHESGVRAKGTVSKVEEHSSDPSVVRLTIKHADPPKGGGFDAYPPGRETELHVPKAAAAKMPFGQKVHVSVQPVESADDGDGDEDDDAPAPKPAVKAPARAKSPNRAANVDDKRAKLAALKGGGKTT